MPVLNYTRDVLPWDSDPADWTDDEIASSLNGQTVAPITTGSALQYLPGADWWVERQGGVYEGKFESYKDDPSTPNAIKNFLADIWSVVFGKQGRTDVGTMLIYNRNGVIVRTNKDTAGDHLLRQGSYMWKGFFDWALTAADPLVQEEIDEFYAYGNGLLYPASDVTAADVQASRDAYNTETDLQNDKQLLNGEYQRLYNLHIAPIASSQDPADVTDQAMKDALLAMNTGWVDQL